MSPFRAGATLLLAAATAVTVALPARAQEPGGDTTTTTATTESTATTATTAPPSSPPTSLPAGAGPEDAAPGSDPLALPGAETTSTTVPLGPEHDPAALADAPSETVPSIDVTVPPRPIEPTGSYAGQGSFAEHPGRIVRVTARGARARASEAQAVLDAAIARRDELVAWEAQLRTDIARLAVEERAAIEALEAAQLALEQRAADAYIRGNLGEARSLILSSDATQFAQRVELLQVVVEADERAVDVYQEARRAVDDEQLAVAAALADVSAELVAAEEAVLAAELEREVADRELAVSMAGGSLVIHGFVFPVAEPYSFGDSFGAPRMLGTEHEHWHEGTDIMAPFGTLLLACERGVIMRIGTGGVLGGNTVWLRGESGVAYYYAHLQTFAPGLRQGMVVDAGTVIGTVGDTGNARGGAPHLHFEVHPNGGAAINPYPILAVAEQQPQPEPVFLE